MLPSLPSCLTCLNVFGIVWRNKNFNRICVYILDTLLPGSASPFVCTSGVAIAFCRKGRF